MSIVAEVAPTSLGKVVGLNKFCDVGALMLEDCQSFSNLDEK